MLGVDIAAITKIEPGLLIKHDAVRILEVIIDLIKILDRVFPGMTEDDWDHVAVDELAGAIWLMLKAIGAEIAKIPTESKN